MLILCYMYVSADGAGKCMEAAPSGGQLIAFATHCQQEVALDRYSKYSYYVMHAYIIITYVHTYIVNIHIHIHIYIYHTIRTYIIFIRMYGALLIKHYIGLS